jgi:hypothetical protein
MVSALSSLQHDGGSRDDSDRDRLKESSPGKVEDRQVPKSRSQVQADYFARLKQSGYKKVTMWLPFDTVENLRKLRKLGFASNEAAITHALAEAAARGDKPKS